MIAKEERMKVSKEGIDFIKRFEGLHDGDMSKIGLQPKMCPAGIWTAGYGHAMVNKKTGKFLVGTGDYKLIAEQYPELETMTEEEAANLLDKDLDKYESIVNRKIKVNLKQNEFDMLVSHTFNTGGSETLFTLINKKKSAGTIREWWTKKYISSNGVTLPGLIRRRNEEFELYSK